MSDARAPVGILLAAGLGTRLRPATDFCPKPLIPVAGLEPLFFALYRLREARVRRVIVNAHHLSEKIDARLKDWAPLLKGLEIRLSVERPEILGTGGALLKIFRDSADWFRDSAALVQNADTLARIDLQPFLRNPEKNLLAISRRKDHLAKYGPLWLRGEGPSIGQWVTAGSQAGAPGLIPAHFLGVHMISGRALAKLTGERFAPRAIDLFDGLYRPLIQEGEVFESLEYFGVPTTEQWFDMNTPEFLLEAQSLILERIEQDSEWTAALQARHPGLRHPSEGVWIRGVGPRKTRPPLVWAEESTAAWSEPWDVLAGPGASVVIEKDAPAPTQSFEIAEASLLVRSAGTPSAATLLRKEVSVW